jgi:hypothetical protein
MYIYLFLLFRFEKNKIKNEIQLSFSAADMFIDKESQMPNEFKRIHWLLHGQLDKGFVVYGGRLNQHDN